jgi:hypothetical protein
MDGLQIIDTNVDNIQNGASCGYKDIKQEGYRRKVDLLLLELSTMESWQLSIQ